MSATRPLTQEIIDTFVGSAHGDFDTVKSLLQQYPELVNQNASWNEFAIEAAAQTGRVDIANFLLDAGASLDICTAAMLGSFETVQGMLEENPDNISATGAHGIPLIYFPVIRGDLQLASFLFESGASVNGGAGVSSPLHGAVMFNQPEMVIWLLDNGADTSILNYDGKTARQLASETGDQALLDCFTSGPPNIIQ